MRILLLSTSMGMGGADQQILELAIGLQTRGHRVRVVTLAPLGQMGREAAQQGIQIESLELQRGIGDVRQVVHLVRMLRQWQPDVLHSHLLHANLLASALRPVAGVPTLIATIHSINQGGPLWMAAYRLASCVVDRFTIISRVAAERYVAIGAIPASRLEVIPNSVDTQRFRRMAAARSALRREFGLTSEFAWLAVGRYEEAKDHKTMIAAFAQLAFRKPDSRLLLVGKGSLQADVEGLVRDAGLENQVRFLGVRRDVPEIMSAADGYVLSSAWEGLPVVLLEAAAVELPIVATDVGGVSEAVEDGVSGFLVPAADPTALAHKMEYLESLSPEARSAMGARGRTLVETRYSKDQVLSTWERLYQKFTRGTG